MTRRDSSIARQTLGIYFQAGLSYKKDLWLALLQPLGAIFINVGMPFFAGQAIAAIALDNGKFGRAIFLLVASTGIGLITNRIGFLSLMSLQAKSMDDMGQMVFDRLLARSLRYHSNNVSGKLVSDALDFVTSYATLVLAFVVNGLTFLLTMFFGLLLVFYQSWQLGLFLLFVAGTTMYWAYSNAKRRSELRAERLKASKKLIGHIADTVVNVQTVKIFAAEGEEMHKNRDLNKKLLSLRLHDWREAGKSGNNRIAYLLLMVLLLLVLIKHLASTDADALGASIFAFTYTFTIILRLFDINNITRLIEESMLNAEPMTRMLAEPIEIVDEPDAKALAVNKGQIQFSNVGFVYEETGGNQRVFKDLQLHIHPGEKVGLMGPSGGGKSTFTRLFMRLEDIQSGVISIDGQDISKVTQTSLRQQIAYVPQEPLLFHRSIAENIAYGKPGATEKEVQNAAKLAHAHDFIKDLPSGYETVVGERGIKLSGGQRQRVAIARAIIKDAPILILDEATSALDSESESLIQDSLKELMKDKTSVVIAHRLSTIQRMDRIVVLDEGKIVEEGSHGALLAQKGLYSRLWKHQSGGFLQE